MTDTDHTHEDACLMCAVRALTEGYPSESWTPDTEGQTISGVVLKQGEVATNLGAIPFVDLWTGGTHRVRVMAYAITLRHALARTEALVGDRLQVWFDGQGILPAKGDYPEHSYKRFSVNVQRGH